MSAAVERSLFATKGRATPNGAGSAVLPTAGGAAASPAGPLQTPLPAEDAAGRAAAAAAESAPVGSLLDFRLRGVAGKSALTDEIKAALRQRTATTAAKAAPPARRPEPATASAGASGAAKPLGAEPTPTSDAAEARRPDDPVSSRIDRPVFPPTPAEAATGNVASPSLPRSQPTSPTSPQPAAVAARPSAARTVLPAAAAVVAIAVVGWLIADTEPPAPTAAHDPGDAPAAMASDADPVTPAVAATAQTVVAPPPAQMATAAGPAPASPSPAATSVDIGATAAEPAAPAQPVVDNPPAGPPAGPLAGSLADVPTLDVVRVEPGAAAVLAGRAAPGSELIVLDNGAPIGTAVADGNGEWALVGDAPLPVGRHELSLALKTPDGTVVVEQADTQAAAALPTPAQKPVAGAAPAGRYVIQLASVPSAADAEREWTRLQAAHPALLGSRSVEVDAAEIGDRGTFYRLRTGPFGDRDEARLLCRELNAAGQECLVVRAAGAE